MYFVAVHFSLSSKTINAFANIFEFVSRYNIVLRDIHLKRVNFLASPNKNVQEMMEFIKTKDRFFVPFCKLFNCFVQICFRPTHGDCKISRHDRVVDLLKLYKTCKFRRQPIGVRGITIEFA